MLRGGEGATKETAEDGTEVEGANEDMKSMQPSEGIEGTSIAAVRVGEGSLEIFHGLESCEEDGKAESEGHPEDSACKGAVKEVVMARGEASTGGKEDESIE